MSKEITVIIKWYSEAKGYGFFSRPAGKDIFVHVTTLERHGFAPVDMIIGHSARIEYSSNGLEKAASVIHQINDKLATKVVDEAVNQKPTQRTNQKRAAMQQPRAEKKPWVAGKAPTLTMDMFYEVGPCIATNKTTRVSLHEVYNSKGDLAQYVLCRGGIPLHSTGKTSEAAAKVFMSLLCPLISEPA